MQGRPRRWLGIDAAVTQQHLADAMARVHQIATTRVVRTRHLPGGLDLWWRHDHARQRPGQQQPRQQLGILRSVLTLSDEPRGVLPGAITCIAIPAAVAAR